MAEYLRKECGDLNKVTSDNNDVKDDDANSKDAEVVEIGTGETLEMLCRLVNLKYLSLSKGTPMSSTYLGYLK